MKLYLFLSLFSIFLLFACSDENTQNTSTRKTDTTTTTIQYDTLDINVNIDCKMFINDKEAATLVANQQQAVIIPLDSILHVEFKKSKQDAPFLVSLINRTPFGEYIIKLEQDITSNTAFVDQRDGKQYQIQQVGEYYWMAEDLKFSTPFNQFIKQNAPSQISAFYYYLGSEQDTICPEGWKVPSVYDWQWLFLQQAGYIDIASPMFLKAWGVRSASPMFLKAWGVRSLQEQEANSSEQILDYPRQTEKKVRKLLNINFRSYPNLSDHIRENWETGQLKRQIIFPPKKEANSVEFLTSSTFYTPDGERFYKSAQLDEKNWGAGIATLRSKEAAPCRCIKKNKVQLILFKDARDLQVYELTQIQNQYWMAENSRYKTTNAIHYTDLPDFKYGSHYPKEEIKGVCPPNWHLATQQDWESVISLLGVKNTMLEKPRQKLLSMLKAEDYWDVDYGGNDKLGLGIIPSDTERLKKENHLATGTIFPIRQNNNFSTIEFGFDKVRFANPTFLTKYFPCRCVYDPTN
ncbi:MAG: hypothetical protein MK212_14505 [Saprospiraceae bacterium]|nr:hypothetical protein [Saprospiraceae bacterium]